MASNVNINFHQTFKPESSYIASILEVSDGTCFGSVQEISSNTGIPQGTSSGKVEPHIQYATFMGLITAEKGKDGYKLQRTNLGEVVYAEDPGLQEELTLLLCHAMMCRNENGAPLWNESFGKVIPRYNGSISKDYLIEELNQVYGGKVSSKNISPMLNAYTDMFEEIDILHTDGNDIKTSEVKKNKEFKYLFAYILLALWDEKFADQDEISSVQLEELNFGNIFGWGKKSEYEVLERLAESNLLRLNRQLVPYTIYRQVSFDEIEGLLYSDLF